jgi:hypothetical protein
MLGTDRLLKKQLITRAFTFFFLAVAIIPLIGPPAALFFILFIRFYPIYPVRTEAFDKVNRDVLLVMQKRFEGRTIPVSEALLIRTLSRGDALKTVAILDEMDWSSTKSGLLKYMIRLRPFQNVVLMAIDMIHKKMDGILTEIASLSSLDKPDRDTWRSLANLYHEICYLDLCEPAMKPFYEAKACEYAISSYRAGESEEDALFAVRYLLEADRIRDARQIYDHIRDKGHYFFPKWITYEFELSVRTRDIDTFNDLYLLIESAGGVFIPGRVKEAAKAWKRVLTSAWL